MSQETSQSWADSPGQLVTLLSCQPLNASCPPPPPREGAPPSEEGGELWASAAKTQELEMGVLAQEWGSRRVPSVPPALPPNIPTPLQAPHSPQHNPPKMQV